MLNTNLLINKLMSFSLSILVTVTNFFGVQEQVSKVMYDLTQSMVRSHIVPENLKLITVTFESFHRFQKKKNKTIAVKFTQELTIFILIQFPAN